MDCVVVSDWRYRRAGRQQKTGICLSFYGKAGGVVRLKITTVSWKRLDRSNDVEVGGGERPSPSECLGKVTVYA